MLEVGLNPRFCLGKTSRGSVECSAVLEKLAFARTSKRKSETEWSDIPPVFREVFSYK
jgi:hypothetical protein